MWIGWSDLYLSRISITELSSYVFSPPEPPKKIDLFPPLQEVDPNSPDATVKFDDPKVIAASEAKSKAERDEMELQMELLRVNLSTLRVIEFALIPPILVLFLGTAGCWVIRGFRPRV